MLSILSHQLKRVGLTANYPTLVVDVEPKVVSAPERAPGNLHRCRECSRGDRQNGFRRAAGPHCFGKLRWPLGGKLYLVAVERAAPSAYASCRKCSLKNRGVNVQHARAGFKSVIRWQGRGRTLQDVFHLRWSETRVRLQHKCDSAGHLWRRETRSTCGRVIRS